MIKMVSLDPGIMRDVNEAKADLAKHGVVIIRAIGTDLEPAIMAEVKSTMASSPGRLAKMEDEELDRLVEKLRRVSEKSVEQLTKLYVRLLTKLGGQSLVDLAKELDGIEQLMKWERIAKTVEPLNAKLSEEGFRHIELLGPEAVSESLKVELEQKWPASFDRFKALAKEAAAQLDKTEAEEEKQSRPSKAKRQSRKG